MAANINNNDILATNNAKLKPVFLCTSFLIPNAKENTKRKGKINQIRYINI